VWGPTDDIHLSNGSADGNDIEYMKNYNIWHKAQVCIFYSIEHTSYIFLWHTGIFLDNIWSTANTTSRNNKSRHAHVHAFPLFLFLLWKECAHIIMRISKYSMLHGSNLYSYVILFLQLWYIILSS
jgi:hypothetical protein